MRYPSLERVLSAWILYDGRVQYAQETPVQRQNAHRWLSMSLVIATGLPWSLSLGVMGLWMMDRPRGGVLGDPLISTSAGIASVCAAQIVFLLCIADRIFPRTHRVVARTIEGGLGMIFLGAIGVLAVDAIVSWGGS